MSVERNKNIERRTTYVKNDNTPTPKKWYTLRVISGQERKLKGYLDMEIRKSNWEDHIFQLLVPTEKVYKVVKAKNANNKKVVKDKNLYPGYIFVLAHEAFINADIVQVFRSFTGVIGFIGRENPEPMSDEDANRMLGKVDELRERGDEAISEPFLVNETVKIIDGPFNDFNGIVEEIYEDKRKLKVIVKIFGRRTPVELNFLQVEKVS